MADIGPVSIDGQSLLPAPQCGPMPIPPRFPCTATRTDCLQIVLAVAPPASVELGPRRTAHQGQPGPRHPSVAHPSAHNSTASASDRNGSPLRGMNSWAMNPVNPVSRIARAIAG